MAVATQTIAAKPPKGWIATLVVAAIMVAIVVGGFIAAGAVTENRSVLYNVNGVGVTPIPGWDFVGRGDDGRTILLTNGSGSLAITVYGQPTGPIVTEPIDWLARKRDEWLATGTATATEIVDVTVGDRTGRRFSYAGTFEDLATPVEGQVSEIDGAKSVALFDGWADKGQFSVVKDDIDAMIESAVIP
jgi:hypothetical protein